MPCPLFMYRAYIPHTPLSVSMSYPIPQYNRLYPSNQYNPLIAVNHQYKEPILCNLSFKGRRMASSGLMGLLGVDSRFSVEDGVEGIFSGLDV